MCLNDNDRAAARVACPILQELELTMWSFAIRSSEFLNVLLSDLRRSEVAVHGSIQLVPELDRDILAACGTEQFAAFLSIQFVEGTPTPEPPLANPDTGGTSDGSVGPPLANPDTGDTDGGGVSGSTGAAGTAALAFGTR